MLFPSSAFTGLIHDTNDVVAVASTQQMEINKLMSYSGSINFMSDSWNVTLSIENKDELTLTILSSNVFSLKHLAGDLASMEQAVNAAPSIAGNDELPCLLQCHILFNVFSLLQTT